MTGTVINGYAFGVDDRYVLDSRLSSADLWAQVDTEQDASYYGKWANADRKSVIEFTEGDLRISEFDTVDEFTTYLRGIDTYEQAQGRKPLRIDTHHSKSLTASFTGIGVDDLLH